MIVEFCIPNTDSFRYWEGMVEKMIVQKLEKGFLGLLLLFGV